MVMIEHWTDSPLNCLFFSFSAGATVEGEDLSLYYGDIKQLTTITKSRKFLPDDLYGRMVRDCVICCVDCLLVRTTLEGTKECLLVLRSSEPVKGVWWLPGGRLLKGESFFAAAKRKALQETGLSNVKCVQVLGVWNTFFPTSNWDTKEEKGTQTVNPIVLVELGDPGADVKLDDTSEEVRIHHDYLSIIPACNANSCHLDSVSQWRWIGLDPQKAIENGEDKYVVQALLRLQAWNPSYNK